MTIEPIPESFSFYAFQHVFTYYLEPHQGTAGVGDSGCPALFQGLWRTSGKSLGTFSRYRTTAPSGRTCSSDSARRAPCIAGFRNARVTVCSRCSRARPVSLWRTAASTSCMNATSMRRSARREAAGTGLAQPHETKLPRESFEFMTPGMPVLF